MRLHDSQYLEALTIPAVTALLHGWLKEGGGRQTVLVLLAEADKEAVTLIQRAAATTGVELAGAVFPAVIANGHILPRGAVFALMPGDTQLAIFRDDELTPTIFGQAVAELAGEDEPGPLPTLLFLVDVTVPDVARLLDAAFLALGDAVRYVGLSAGSESFVRIPCIFDGERLVSGAALVAVLRDDVTSALAHGYLPLQEAHVASSSDDNTIRTIDWKPAFEFYRTFVREQLGVTLTAGNFYREASHFPLGLMLANGDILVRLPVSVGPEGSVECAGAVPSQSLLVVLRGPEPGDAQTMTQLAKGKARGVHTGAPLFFMCAGRYQHLGPLAEGEIRQAQQTMGVPVLGATTLGEIGCLRADTYPHFHNGTLVLLDWNAQ